MAAGSLQTSDPEAAGDDEPVGLADAPWVVSTYFAEGLPFSIVRQLSSQFFTAMGASLTAIGMTSLFGLAWNLKLLWSPLVDRHGTMRGWLLGMQASLALVVMALAVPVGQGDLGRVGKGLVAVAVLAATHDIAIDGFYLGALEKKAQARLSGLRVAAYRGALLVGNGLLVILAGVTSWRTTFLAAGGILLALTGAHAVFLPKSPPKAAPKVEVSAGAAYLEAFTSFLKQPGIVASLGFILLYNLGDSLMFAMSAPFLKSLGLGDVHRGTVGGIGIGASILGGMAGGAIISKLGLRRAITPIAVAQSLAIPLYVVLSLVKPGAVAVGAVAVFEQLAAGLGSSAFVVFLMRRCSPKHKAAHFAIATALMTVASTGSGYASGFLATQLGFTAFFGLAFVASLPGVLLSRFVPKD